MAGTGARLDHAIKGTDAAEPNQEIETSGEALARDAR